MTCLANLWYFCFVVKKKLIAKKLLLVNPNFKPIWPPICQNKFVTIELVIIYYMLCNQIKTDSSELVFIKIEMVVKQNRIIFTTYLHLSSLDSSITLQELEKPCLTQFYRWRFQKNLSFLFRPFFSNWKALAFFSSASFLKQML